MVTRLRSLALAAAALAFGACAAREETTPLGYVIAPSVPADAGGGGVPAVDGGAASYSSPVIARDARK